MPQGLIEPQEAIGAPKIAQTRRSRISITLAVYSNVFEEDHPLMMFLRRPTLRA